MILFTKIEIFTPKNKKEDSNEYDALTRRVLADIEGEPSNKIEMERTAVDAIVNLHDNLLFYEFNGATYIENFDSSSAIKTLGSLDDIKSIYTSAEAEDFDLNSLSLQEIDEYETTAIESIKGQCKQLRANLTKI